MRLAVASLGAGLLLLGLGGCRTGPPSVGDPPPRLADFGAERSYRKILDRYTGTGEIYTGLTTQLFAGATYQSWAFREARVRRTAQFKAMSGEEEAALLAQERSEWDQFHVFELGTWSREPRFDDFDRKGSIWRIAMTAGRVEVLPQEVSRISRVDQDVRAIYPYMGEFWVRYRVRFPKVGPDGTVILSPGTSQISLKLASSLGKTELRTEAE